MHSQHRGVEQLVARRAHNPEVGGPSPPSATKQEVNPNGWPLIVFPPHFASHHIQQPLTHLFKYRNSKTNIQIQLTAHLFAHKNPDFVLETPEIGGPEGKKAQKPRFCARNARNWGSRRQKAHKKAVLCSRREGIGIGKHNRRDAYRKRGLPANHRAHF